MQLRKKTKLSSPGGWLEIWRPNHSKCPLRRRKLRQLRVSLMLTQERQQLEVRMMRLAPP
jgi:hypothetical protein